MRNNGQFSDKRPKVPRMSQNQRQRAGATDPRRDSRQDPRRYTTDGQPGVPRVTRPGVHGRITRPGVHGRCTDQGVPNSVRRVVQPLGVRRVVQPLGVRRVYSLSVYGGIAVGGTVLFGLLLQADSGTALQDRSRHTGSYPSATAVPLSWSSRPVCPCGPCPVRLDTDT